MFWPAELCQAGRRLSCGDRSCFTGLAGVCLADMVDHPHLHRDDLQLFAGFLADDVLAAAAFAGQFVLGQFVDDFHARQVGREGLAFAATLRWGDDFFGLDLIRSGGSLPAVCSGDKRFRSMWATNSKRSLSGSSWRMGRQHRRRARMCRRAI